LFLPVKRKVEAWKREKVVKRLDVVKGRVTSPLEPRMWVRIPAGPFGGQ
jgi:hypothetical protein